MTASLDSRDHDHREVTTAARVLVAVVVAVGIAVAIASTPLRVDQLGTACETDSCPAGQLTEIGLEKLATEGITVDSYVAWVATLDVAAVAVYLTLAVILATRRRLERMAAVVAVLFTGLALATFPLPTLSAEWSGWQGIDAVISQLSAGPGVVLFAALFPDGRFVPRWSRWVVLVAAADELARIFLADYPLNPAGWGEAAQGIELLFWISLLFGFQVYRYRKVSNRNQRLQTKWVILGFGVTLAANLLVAFAPVVSPTAGDEGSLPALIVSSILDLTLLLTPLAITVAVLRYRLFDIDRIVSRTVTYTLVIGLLAAVYAAATVFLTQVLPVDSTLAIAASTLAVAALFTPLRRRIQRIVDRRFNRTRYRAEREVEAFTIRLRDTTDIDTVQADLIDVISRTLQPSAVGVWIRGHSGTPRTSGHEPWAETGV